MSRKVIKTSILFTLLSIGASALNFAFYPLMSHLLTLSDFGSVQVGISFVMLAAALFSSLSTLALYAAAYAKDTNSGVFIEHIERLVISVSLFLVIFTVLFAPYLSEALNLGDPSLLYILAVIFLINIPAATWIGTLQGTGRFIASGVISIAAAAVKLVAAVLFVLLGFGATGALFGIALGSFIILPLVRFFDSTDQINYSRTFSIVKKCDIHFFFRQKSILVILISLIIIAAVGSLDVIAAKSQLSSDEAGAFAQLSTAAKIPYFATIPLAIILFEKLVRRSIKQIHATCLFIITNIFIALLTWLFSSVILKYFFNQQTTSPKEFTALLTAFTILSIVTFMAYRFIAEKNIMILYVSSTVGIVATYVLLFDSTLRSSLQIANAYLTGVGFILFIMIVLRYTVGYERKKS